MPSYPHYIQSLLHWGKIHYRRFPWRRNKKPYRILVAEFLLQKTDSKKALHAYEIVIKRFPDVTSLSKVSPEKLAKCLGGIGLWYRAERLIATAKVIVTEFGGCVPNNMEDLINLPGIGRYIASAILCFAFGNAAALIDTNIARIIQRYWGFNIRASRPREDKELWEFAMRLVPQPNAAAYNYALIDLGTLICKSRHPTCEHCPLLKECSYAHFKYDKRNHYI